MSNAKIVAIGDIHGCADLLVQLFSSIENEWQWDHIVFLGDYIDRGSQSRQVIDFILNVTNKYPGKITTLKGNHEQWMLMSADNPYKLSWVVGMEGLSAMESYDKEFAELFQQTLRQLGAKFLSEECPEIAELQQQFFSQIMPVAHLEFFRNLELFYQAPGVLFVHAGLDPSIPLEQQTENELLWITDPFYQGYSGEDTIIFGHHSTLKMRQDQLPLPYIGSNRIIGIDTGSSKTGVITAYRWPDGAILNTRPIEE